MIETFVVDWPVLLLLGLVFGALDRSESGWSSRALWAGAVSAGVFTAVALISYAIAPDWMWMYFLDPSTVSWAVPVIAIGYLFVYAVGFAAALGFKAAAPPLLIAAIAGAFALELVAIALTWDRYHLIGTAAEWSNGRADELLTLTPEGSARTIALLGPVFIATFVACLVVAARSRRPAAG